MSEISRHRTLTTYTKLDHQRRVAMASRQRLFYDPANPRMLAVEEIQRLNASDIQAASDQIDQNMVVLLQRIEENFARCNQVVIERILPAVAQHGENSQRIYESVKVSSLRLHARTRARELITSRPVLETVLRGCSCSTLRGSGLGST